ncbi:MAG: hypothetical protein ACYTEW_27420 [Planctomycetota bacterium]|jgi:hypothetical protein
MADLFGAVATAILSKFEGNTLLVNALGGSTGRYAKRMFNRRAPEIDEDQDKAQSGEALSTSSSTSMILMRIARTMTQHSTMCITSSTLCIMKVL